MFMQTPTFLKNSFKKHSNTLHQKYLDKKMNQLGLKKNNQDKKNKTKELLCRKTD